MCILAMQCAVTPMTDTRRHHRRSQVGEILLLRVFHRVACEIERRRRLGGFTWRHMGELLGDKKDSDQAQKDMASINSRRVRAIGYKRLMQFVEVLDLDPDTIFLPIEKPTRSKATAVVEQVAA